MQIMDIKNTSRNTSGKILQDALLAQCLISKRYVIDLHMSELQDHLHDEELFLAFILSEMRDGHISTKVDFEGLLNSPQ